MSLIFRSLRTAAAFSGVSTLALLALAPRAQAQIVNPSFEQPVVGAENDQVFATGDTIGSGWFVQSTDNGVVLIDNGFTGGGVVWHPATDGNQYLYLASSTGNSVVRQDFSLSALAYRLQFDQADFATVFSTPGGEVTVDLVNANTLVSIIGGPQTFTTPDFSDYLTRTINFSAPTAATYRLLLTSTAGRAGLVDNFRLSAQGGVAAPEPGSMALLGVGTFSVVGLVHRRKR